MRLETPYEIRDPVHGLIRLTALERQIIDTSIFQRLRRIRQLAMADLVYPGALHTRFEHLLGTMHVAQRILERLDSLEHMFDNNDSDVRVVRLAALLHDVGHGPFSHVSEHLLDRYYDRTKIDPAASREKIHEKLTIDLISRHPELSGLIPNGQRMAVADIIRGTGQRDWRRDIVSSSLDADKMDYLLRDAYYAGVQYGHYDLEKVIDACRVVRAGGESYLMVREDGLFAVEQLVLAKHHMTQQVYAHRVRTITDLMIVRGLELAIEADQAIRAAYTYDGSDEHLNAYLQLDDARIVAVVLEGKNGPAKSIYRRLRDRRLLKELAVITIDEQQVPNSVQRAQLMDLSANQLSKLEATIAEHLECEPWEVIVHRKSIKNPAYQPPGGLEPEAIQVLGYDDTPRSLSQFSMLARALNPTTERLHVIGPRDEPVSENPASRQQQRNVLAQEVRHLVLANLGG